MQLSEAEWKVMNSLWERHPASARDVLEALGDDTQWAYTTIKTILERLVDKGALAVSKRGNRSYYEPLLEQDRARHSALRGLMDRAFAGGLSSLMASLVGDEKLSRRERSELKKMIDKLGSGS